MTGRPIDLYEHSCGQAYLRQPRRELLARTRLVICDRCFGSMPAQDHAGRKYGYQRANGEMDEAAVASIAPTAHSPGAAADHPR